MRHWEQGCRARRLLPLPGPICLAIRSCRNGTGLLRDFHLLLRSLADRHDIRGRFPNFFIGQHFAPRRHAEAALLPAVGNRLENAFGVEIASGQIDTSPAVYPVTMRTLLFQKDIVSGRNHLRVFEVRDVLFRIGHIADKNPCNHHRHQSAHYGNYSNTERNKSQAGRLDTGRPFVACFAYLASLKAISAEAAGTFSSCGNNAGSKTAAYEPQPLGTKMYCSPLTA